MFKSMFIACAVSLCVAVYAGEDFQWSGSTMNSWKVANSKKTEFTDAGVSLVSGNDVMMIVNGLNIPATEYTDIEIVMNISKATESQMFFTAQGENFNEKSSVRFKAEKGEKTYRVNCGANTAWNGTITSLRFDPTNKPDIDISVKSIKVLPALCEWNFNTENKLNGWISNAYMINSTIAAEGISFTSGNDPFITSAKLNLAAEKFTKIEVVMKSSADSVGQLFFTTPGKNFNEKCSFRFPVKASAEWQTYTIDLTSNNEWKGVIATLRFDPVSSRDINVVLKSIKLLP